MKKAQEKLSSCLDIVSRPNTSSLKTKPNLTLLKAVHMVEDVMLQNSHNIYEYEI